MYMTDSEILLSYKTAKFKNKQIGILADLNLCSRAKIVEILVEGGADPTELPALARYKKGRENAQAEKAPPDNQQAKGGGRRWVWNPNKNKTADELIQQALDRYEHLKQAFGERDPYVVGFKHCIDLLKGQPEKERIEKEAKR